VPQSERRNRRLERKALAHSLKKLFRSKSLHPDEAVADALGLSGRYVKKRRYFYCLSQGYASAISGTDLGWRDVVDLLRKHEWIRPATEVVGASLWPFLRGELTPTFGVTELVEHHAAKVNFTWISLSRGLRARLAARAEGPSTNIVLPIESVVNVMVRQFPDFLGSAVTISDKMTLMGLLYVEALLARSFEGCSMIGRHLNELCDSKAFDETFGTDAILLRTEFMHRVYGGQLLQAYGQRSAGATAAVPGDRVLLPTEAVERVLDGLLATKIPRPDQYSRLVWRATRE
jgi:hypothetical protein